MFGVQFYPTPEKLADKMVSKLKLKDYMSILEPSAGKGDLVSALSRRAKETGYKFDLNCIEISPELRAILKDKHYNIVGYDFLSYKGLTKYDVIIMNPPFSEGDKHLLKAINIMKNGGQIVCILNAETIKNPYSNTRQDLLNKLHFYCADIEFLQNEFLEAEVKTNVEIALIYIDIPCVEKKDILSDLKKSFEEEYRDEDKDEDDFSDNQIVENDIIEALIKQYNFECELGLKVIREFKTLQKYVPKHENGQYLLNLNVLNPKESESGLSLENRYLRELRGRYWSKFFMSDKITKLMTYELREQYMAELNHMRAYDFSKENILQIQLDLSKNMIQNMDDAILRVFDKLTYEHSMGKNKNIHYYNGWKTNKACIVNKKVIIPFYGSLFTKWGYWDLSIIRGYFQEIEQIFNYLDGCETEGKDFLSIISDLSYYRKYDGERIECKYFDLDLKKKGTVHVYFKNEKLLKKFNIFAGKKKGWLPGNYGSCEYEQMTQEEKDVIDSFEGKENYVETFKNSNYYLSESKLKLLN